MGLLDFAKDVGRQIFDTDAEAADNIKEHLEVKTSGITDLEVDYDDGVVTLCGKCNSHATRDLALLIAGNIEGVERIIADDFTAPDPEPPVAAEKTKAAPAPKSEFYDIVSGDTLGAIAEKYYGSASEYMRIFDANRDIIDDPDKIYPGQKIRIPIDDSTIH